MAQLFTNLPRSTLAKAHTSGETTLFLSLGGGSGFPVIVAGSGDFFKVLVYKKSTNTYEIVKVEGRDGDLLTGCTRGIDSTTSLSFAAGDDVLLPILASDLMDVVTRAGHSIWGVDSGSANAYVVTMSPPVTELTVGMEIRFTPAATNTGASTLNLDGLGASNIQKPSSGSFVALSANDIYTGGIVSVLWTGSLWQLRNVP